MYAEIDDLPDGLRPEDAAMVRAGLASDCEFCRVPALMGRSTRAEELAWLQRYYPDVAAALAAQKSACDASEEASHHAWYGSELSLPAEDEFLRLKSDSSLGVTVDIPFEIVSRVARNLGDRERDFVVAQLVYAVCQRCKAEPMSQSAVEEERMLDRFVTAHLDGNRQAAEAQPMWPLLREIVVLIGVEARAFMKAG